MKQNLLSYLLKDDVLTSITESIHEQILVEADRDQVSVSMTCSTCKLGMKSLDTLLKSQSFINKLETFAIKICANDFVYNDTVCPGGVKNMGDILVPVLADSLLSADYMCAYFLEICATRTYTKFFAADYATEILSTKPQSL